MRITDKAEFEVKLGEAETDRSRTTVYYDGSCPLCSVEIGHYTSCDGAEPLSFVDVSKADANFGSDLTRQQAMDRLHVRLPNGKLVSGARGFTMLWDTLPQWRWLARLTRMPGITPMSELAYRVFLPLRPVLSRIASWFGAKPLNQTDTQM